jgi:hypothetical protein
MPERVPAYPIELRLHNGRTKDPGIKVQVIQWRSQRVRGIHKGAHHIPVHLLYLASPKNVLGPSIEEHILDPPGLGLRQGDQSPLQVHIRPAKLELLAQTHASENRQPSAWPVDWSKLVRPPLPCSGSESCHSAPLRALPG